MAKTHPVLADRLKESGIRESEAATLRLEYLTGDQTAQLGFKKLTSIKIPYFDFLGRPVTYGPDKKPFFRIRYMEKLISFDQTQGDKKPLKYTQPPGSGTFAYFPMTIDWREITNDTSKTLFLTEGEFKAAKGCAEGFPTIGLGGVYNWKAMKSGVILLPELAAINWAHRDAVIVFDSDFRSNNMVCQAIVDLAEELAERGALPKFVALPQEGDKKVGLDDFLLAQGKEAFNELISAAEPLTLARELWRMNDDLVYVRDPGLVTVLLSSNEFQKMAPAAFKEHSGWATKRALEPTIDKSGDARINVVAAAGAWLHWNFRREVHRMTYAPGKPQFTVDRGQSAMNLWVGWGIEPRPGNVEPFLQLVRHVFTGAEPAAMEWFLDWCAHPLQYPGTKMFSAAVIYGLRHGTGKSLIGYTLGAIYGKNFTEISQGDLHASFNEWAEGKQLVLGDDVTGSNKRQDADLLKKLITQREMRLNPKYVPSYTIPDCINYIFTSNHPDAFFLEEDDRRFFIHEVTVAPMDEEFYVEYQLWLDSGGAAALFDYLLKRDIAGFNPAAPAFRTMARARMIADVRSDLAAWVNRMRENPDSVLRIGDHVLTHDLMTSTELLLLYRGEQEMGRLTSNGMTRELRRQGVPMVLNGVLVPGPLGHDRYYIIRHPNKWVGATREQVLAELKEYGSALADAHARF